MRKKSLEYIATRLATAGINYEFGEWTSDITYPYFVGEYSEPESFTEDGLQEADLILNGFSRTTWIDLETAKETIESLFTYCTTVLSDGTGLNVSYAGALIVPTGDAELKRIQINLSIKEWKVNI